MSPHLGDRRVAHVVLTGGPSAGKSSALGALTTRLARHGWRVLVVPEAATLLIGGGVDDIGVLAAVDREAYLAVQEQLVGVQLDLRARYDALARALPAAKVVVLHDRGVADNAAYMDPGEYAATLAAHRLDPAAAHDLYDAVVHLRSAAVSRGDYDGAGYTRANNTARSEDAQAAATLDEQTLAAWTTHPHLSVVAPAADFTSKVDRTVATVLAALGEPEPVEIERKFLLHGPPDLTHPVLAAAPRVEITQVYLPSADGTERRVRARTVAGVTTYSHTTKTDTGDALARGEVEVTVSAETYQLLRALADPATRPVRKVRRVFVVEDQRFELDEFCDRPGVWLAEVELVDARDQVQLPAFLGPAREVTHDPAWRNRALAQTGAVR